MALRDLILHLPWDPQMGPDMEFPPLTPRLGMLVLVAVVVLFLEVPLCVPWL